MENRTRKRSLGNLIEAIQAADHHQPTDCTLAELCHAYACSVRAQRDDAGRLEIWVSALGDRSAWSITSAHLRAGAAELAARGYSPAYCNRVLGTLGSCYRWAKQTGRSPAGFVSPTLAVSRAREVPRTFTVTQEQLNALRDLAMSNPDRRFACWVAALIDTGCRRSELTERCWSEIDLDAGVIALPADATKTGVARVLHLAPDTVRLWRRTFRDRRPDERPFQSWRGSSTIRFDKRWKTLVAEAQLPGMHIHDIRKACAAALLRSGVGAARAAQVIGNSARTLERCYGQLDVAALGDVASVLHRRAA